MPGEQRDPPAPDRPAADERSSRIVSESEQLMLGLDLDAESRRELDAARQSHVARVASLAKGDAAARIEACLDYLSELGRIAVNSQRRGRQRPDADESGGGG
jgi:hypothetical protein